MQSISFSIIHRSDEWVWFEFDFVQTTHVTLLNIGSLRIWHFCFTSSEHNSGAGVVLGALVDGGVVEVLAVVGSNNNVSFVSVVP